MSLVLDNRGLLSFIAAAEAKREAEALAASEKKRRRKKRVRVYKEGTQASLSSIVNASKIGLSELHLSDSSKLPAIERLDVSKNSLTAVTGLSVLGSSLKHLIVNNNELRQLDVSGLHSLEVIDARNNGIEAIIGLHSCRRTLHTLLLNNNKLTSLSFLSATTGAAEHRQLPFEKLTVLSVSSNPIFDDYSNSKNASDEKSGDNSAKTNRRIFDETFKSLRHLNRLCIAKCGDRFAVSKEASSSASAQKQKSVLAALLLAVFRNCRQLTELRANGNGMRDGEWPSLKVLARAKHLSLLDVGSNQLTQLEPFLKLLSKAFDKMTVLRLFGNPFCEKKKGDSDDRSALVEYNETTILTFLPKVSTLDMRKVQSTAGSIPERAAKKRRRKNARKTIVIRQKDEGKEAADDIENEAKKKKKKKKKAKAKKKKTEESAEKMEGSDEIEEIKVGRGFDEETAAFVESAVAIDSRSEDVPMTEAATGRMQSTTQQMEEVKSVKKKKNKKKQKKGEKKAMETPKTKGKKKRKRKLSEMAEEMGNGSAIDSGHGERKEASPKQKRRKKAKSAVVSKSAKRESFEEEKEMDFAALKQMIVGGTETGGVAAEGKEEGDRALMKAPVFEVVNHKIKRTSKSLKKRKDDDSKLNALQMLLGPSKQNIGDGAFGGWE